MSTHKTSDHSHITQHVILTKHMKSNLLVSCRHFNSCEVPIFTSEVLYQRTINTLQVFLLHNSLDSLNTIADTLKEKYQLAYHCCKANNIAIICMGWQDTTVYLSYPACCGFEVTFGFSQLFSCCTDGLF